MLPIINGNIWFYRRPVDFRKQLMGLVTLISDEMKQNPANGDIYIFRSRKANKVKLVFWQNDGFWLCQKQLSGRRFRFPQKGEEAMVLTANQVQWLLSGANIQKAPVPIDPPSRFF